MAYHSATARAQSLDVKISLTALAPARIRVEGTRARGATAWSFRNSYAGALGLAERLENLVLLDEGGGEVPARKLAPGEFEAARPATRFRYDLTLEPPTSQAHAAHVSWLTPERGILMLGDLLPLPAQGAKVALALPPGWTVASVESIDVNGRFQVRDAEQSVFVVGRDLRPGRARAGSTEYVYTVTGSWAFDDKEVAEAVSSLLKEYEKTMGGAPQAISNIIISPFPRAVAAQVWSAETRGRTVTLVSGVWPSKVAAVSQLSGLLSHELLHLWVPNGLALSGDYDWFYEGFTLYTALRVRMRQGQLSFNDYLNAMGNAFDSYKAARGSDDLSLIDLSRRRFTGNSTLVYNKGMLVAFLYDLTLMRRTKGKNSLEDVYRALFERHREGKNRVDGNDAVIVALSSMTEMREFVRLHVESPIEISLGAALAPFGLRAEAWGSRTRVSVSDSQSREQRDLLRKLGYNEKPDAATRKLHEKFKKRAP